MTSVTFEALHTVGPSEVEFSHSASEAGHGSPARIAPDPSVLDMTSVTSMILSE